MTADALTWRQSTEAIGPHGELCVRHDCVEYPRLYCLSQRASVETEWYECYFVYGIGAQWWHTADEALQAMMANP
jgi:hypothetical protein